MRIAVLLSAGGSAFLAAAKIAGKSIDPFVITDRACAAEEACAESKLDYERIAFSTRSEFSMAVLRACQARGSERLLLLYSRMVGPELYGSMRCMNVHPSLLPAFPGFGATGKLLPSGAKFIGATLHEVDETVDGGVVIAQTVAPIPRSADQEWIDRASFLQKTLLCLFAFEGDRNDRSSSIYLNPDLQTQGYWDGFRALQSSINFELYP
jgi:phosphoribosylglycinamide formyltransferase-1